jgi:hypothetical protein
MWKLGQLPVGDSLVTLSTLIRSCALRPIDIRTGIRRVGAANALILRSLLSVEEGRDGRHDRTEML